MQNVNFLVDSFVRNNGFLDNNSDFVSIGSAECDLVCRCRKIFVYGFQFLSNLWVAGEYCRKHKFVCLFRHKIWWMIPRFGSSGSDIPVETQMLLLELREESAFCDDSSSEQSADSSLYVLLLPVLEGQFRATLQGNSANELEFCVESGKLTHFCPHDPFHKFSVLKFLGEIVSDA